MKDIFIDTNYFIALVNQKDKYHNLAYEWSIRIKNESILCHTTIPILFEIGDGFSKLNRRLLGNNLIGNILEASNYYIHRVSDDSFEKSIELYLKHKDKEWSFTDCFSFYIMKEYNIENALTADHHFEQYGFNILLK